MKISNINKEVKGSGLIQERALRFAYMINKEAIHRAQILSFWHKYGTEATKDAYKVSRATLYRWQSNLNKEKGKLEALNNKSRAPKKRKKRIIDYRIERYIIEQRIKHPRLGKKKLTPLLKAKCIEWNLHPPSEARVGRIIKDLKDKGFLPQYEKLSLNTKTGKLHALKRKKRKKSEEKITKLTNPVLLLNLTPLCFL